MGYEGLKRLCVSVVIGVVVIALFCIGYNAYNNHRIRADSSDTQADLGELKDRVHSAERGLESSEREVESARDELGQAIGESKNLERTSGELAEQVKGNREVIRESRGIAQRMSDRSKRIQGLIDEVDHRYSEAHPQTGGNEKTT